MPLLAEAKTRATEAAVAVLLAASGVTAAIGVFEAQEHHSPIGWFTSCAATFIAATLLPIAVFILFPWIENLSNSSIGRKVKYSPKKDMPLSSQYRKEGRIIIASTPKAIIQDRRKYKTNVEADAAMQRYMGKWIEAYGWLYNMYFIGKNKDELVAVIDSENNPPKSFPKTRFRHNIAFQQQRDNR